MKQFLDIIRSFSILYLMLYLGNLIKAFLSLDIPSSILGLLLLFISLLLKIIKIEWINFGVSLLIRYMAILFIPISVGIVKYANFVIDNAISLLVPNILSTSITLVLTAYLSNYVFNRNSFSHKRKKVLKKKMQG